MRRLLQKPAWRAAALIAVYLGGLALGVVTVGIYPAYYTQRSSMLDGARQIAEGRVETDELLGYLRGSTTRLIQYDGSGECLRCITSDGTGIEVYDALLQKELPAVSGGKDIFRLAFAREESRHLLRMWSVTGVPVREADGNTGALFLIRNLENVQESVLGYFIYFTVLYWLAAYFVVANLRKKRKLDAMQKNYIANVTHALKAPVASIKALTETLSDVPDLDPDKRVSYYGTILRETNVQSHMIQEILDLSKLQSHGMDFTKASVSAEDTFAQCLGKYTMLCECAGISFHVSDELFRLPPLYTNAACIAQVLEILLENAVKYVQDGQDVWLDVSAARGMATFCVRDNGIGIAKSDLPHIFERFYRSSRNPGKSGSGLGLAIAKEIMDGLKEKIWAESEYGKGSAFYFTVRLR